MIGMRWSDHPLVAVARALSESVDPGLAEVGARLTAYAEGRNVATLEAAFGVDRQSLLLMLRDEKVRFVASRFYPGRSWHACGIEMHEHLRRYAATAWQMREHAAEHCPRRPETVEAAFWDLLKLRNAVPSARTIRDILAAERPLRLPTSSSNLMEAKD
jgi:hypothetical protein